MVLLPDCKEVTRLVLMSQDMPLPLRQRLLMRAHWLICENCSRFRQQAGVMRESLDRWRRYRGE